MANSPLPVILTKVEALEHAAQLLEQQAQGMDLAFRIVDVMNKIGAPEIANCEMREDLARFRAATIDPKLQLAAMCDGAKAIRDLALEERIVAARVQAGAGIKS